MSNLPPEPPEPGSPENPYGAPPAGQPSYAQPTYGQPGYGPQFGQPAYGQGYGQGFGQPPQPYSMTPRPSRQMAGWSLGLAIAFCVPFALFVSIGLAIAVLVKSRDGVDRGRGMAIAALAIDGLIVVLGIGFLVLGVLVGPAEDRDTSGQVTSPQTQSVFEIREGDCVNDDALFGSDSETLETTDVEVVPCASSHQMEAYLVVDLPDSDFPGASTVTDLARDRCAGAYRDFVGRAPGRSDLAVFYYVPTETTWDRADDRAVTCLVGDPDAETTGTLRDSKR